MKNFIFIDLTLLAVLLGLMCAPAPLSGSSVLGVFEGTSPCDEVSRKPLQIPATSNCEMIKWNLTLFQTPGSLDPSTYELNLAYGMAQPNTNGLINGGTRVARIGRWTTTRGARTDSYATVELVGEGSQGSMSFLKLDHNLLHLLDSNGNLAVGNGGWSYTLSRGETLQKQTHPANAAATSSVPLKTLTSLTSYAATGSSVLGRFVGRSPCVEVARELGKTVDADCMKVKWALTLYQDSKTLAPTTYKLRGTFYRDQIKEGSWTILRGAKVNPAAVVYQLDGDASQGPLLFLKADNNVLFFLDRDRNLMVGNTNFSYTLNREK